VTHSTKTAGVRRIDLNCDLGEALDSPGGWHGGHEPALLPLISSANVACGGHAGDARSMREVCAAAVQHGVRIGAQVSYPDWEHFGRRALEIAPPLLADSLEEQFSDLVAAASDVGGRVAYVKPHGALYNTVVTRDDHAAVVVELAARHGVSLFGLHNSRTAARASTLGVRFEREWFADRAYLADGTLTPRNEPGALVVDAAAVAARTTQVVNDGYTVALDGALISTAFDTICVHSDTPELLAAVRAAVLATGATVGAA
jgi:UPF0271 protein